MSIENELLNTGLQPLFLSHSLSRNDFAYIYIYIYVCIYIYIYLSLSLSLFFPQVKGACEAPRPIGPPVPFVGAFGESTVRTSATSGC